MDPAELLRAWRRLSRQLGLRRRLVVAALTGVAVVCGLTALRPAAGPTVRVWAAARDLPGGEPLTGADVVVERLPAAAVPGDALRPTSQIVGRLLAAPVRRREPLTDVRLLSGDLLAGIGAPDDVAVPVRVADGPATAALVRPGDRVDVLAAADPEAPAPGRPTTVARGLPVLSVPVRVDDPAGAGATDGGGLVIVAATPEQATALAQAADQRLSVAVGRLP